MKRMSKKKTLALICALQITAGNLFYNANMDKAGAVDSKIEAALQWAIKIANDNSHGYSQSNREGPDYDCSSLVVNALKQAGLNTGSASYTGNLKSELTKYGFTWIPWSSIGNVSNLQRGDILLYRGSSSGHTEFYLGNNQNVGAHSDGGHPEQGDQTGNEISVGSYWYDNWNGVLRYGEVNPVPNPPVIVEGCFPACGSGYTSIVEALKSIGVDSSMTYRKQIAAANNISGYSGTAAQNTEMLSMLKSGSLRKPGSNIEVNVPEPPPVVNYDNTYFPACSSSYTSIIDALKSIGVDSSMSNRTRIAEKNGISGYSGTASQNTDMLSKLKNGKLINPDGVSATPTVSGKYYPACGSAYTSIVEALKSIGVDSSMTYRKEIAAKNGISGYSGTAEQNIQMLSLLKSGSLVRADYSEPPAIVNYTVTLDSCGGFSSVSSLTIASNASYVGLPVATKEGYTFAGWYTSANGGSIIKDGNSLVSASNHTLYAHWTANTYTVSFENNDGSGIGNSKKVTFGSSYGDLPVVERMGYTFLGWFTDISAGSKVTSESKFSYADNQTLYGHWKANQYTISFDANGGSEKIANITVGYMSEYGDLPSISRDGYVFEGWYDKSDNIIKSDFLVTTASNQTLKAKWSKLVTEEFKLNNESVTLKNGEQFTIIANQDELTYKSNNNDVAIVSKKGIVTAVGKGDAIISVVNIYGEVAQLKVSVIDAVTPGDCNSDGKLTVEDVLLIQKYFLNNGNLSNVQTADINQDGKVNIVDFCLLKAAILG